MTIIPWIYRCALIAVEISFVDSKSRKFKVLPIFLNNWRCFRSHLVCRSSPSTYNHITIVSTTPNEQDVEKGSGYWPLELHQQKMCRFTCFYRQQCDLELNWTISVSVPQNIYAILYLNKYLCTWKTKKYPLVGKLNTFTKLSIYG